MLCVCLLGLSALPVKRGSANERVAAIMTNFILKAVYV